MKCSKCNNEIQRDEQNIMFKIEGDYVVELFPIYLCTECGHVLDTSCGNLHKTKHSPTRDTDSTRDET